MTDTAPDADATREGKNGTGAGTPDLDRTVERAFTCTHCGYAMVHEAGFLRREVSAVCHECGDWTVQSAEREALVEAAREAAEVLGGSILTERQALAYLLREELGMDREPAAEAMDSSASNVDNLQRRGREKVEEARRVVAELDAIEGDE